MKQFYIILWKRFEGPKGYWNIKAIDLKGVYDQLVTMFPNEEILLQGHNYRKITNGDHYLAANYPIETFYNGYNQLGSPAHLNRTFFDVVGSDQTIPHNE